MADTIEQRLLERNRIDHHELPGKIHGPDANLAVLAAMWGMAIH